MNNRKDANNTDSDIEDNTVHFKDKTVKFKSRLFLFYWIFAIHGLVYFVQEIKSFDQALLLNPNGKFIIDMSDPEN